MTAGRLRSLLLKVDATAEIVVNGEPVTGVLVEAWQNLSAVLAGEVVRGCQ